MFMLVKSLIGAFRRWQSKRRPGASSATGEDAGDRDGDASGSPAGELDPPSRAPVPAPRPE